MPEDFPALSEHYLTADLPGVGGRLKDRNEDFLVEEIPAYEPCGHGEHLYLHIEKSGRPTLEVVRALARHFSVPSRSVGFAGMKDKHAVTRQWLSVHSPDDQRVGTFECAGVTIVSAARHRNKLRVGHLRGNRFVTRIRDVELDQVEEAKMILQVVQEHGAPNAVGEQRFGYRRLNHLIGRAYLLEEWEQMCQLILGGADDPNNHDFEARHAFDTGDFAHAAMLWPETMVVERSISRALAGGATSEEAVAAAPKSHLAFFISGFQSALFNQILDQRLQRKRLQTLIKGDVAFQHRNGALFRIGDEEVDDASIIERIRRIEISPSGAMWGGDMFLAGGAVGDLERSLLEATGVDVDCFTMQPHDVRGTRRPLRIPVMNPAVNAGSDEFGSYIETRFELPKGSFATTILREIMKTEERQYPWGVNRAASQSHHAHE